jgi:hypothetical protein
VGVTNISNFASLLKAKTNDPTAEKRELLETQWFKRNVLVDVLFSGSSRLKTARIALENLLIQSKLLSTCCGIVLGKVQQQNLPDMEKNSP